MQIRNWFFVLIACLVLACPPADAVDLTLKPLRVAPDVYVVVGDLGPQTQENEGLNNNLGFVVGADGVLVINTGPTTRVAQALHDAIRKITSKPVRFVVNVNSQNHSWLGNDYFRQLGIPVIAHESAIRLMQDLGAGQLNAMHTLLKDKAGATTLAYPTESFGDNRTLRLGKTEVHLLHFGSAHTAGDIAVWLPQQQLLFAGDLVFTERMLAVIPVGNSSGWVKAFDQAMALKPLIIVPGHGKPTDIQTATRDTRDYLVHLRTGAEAVLSKGGSLLDAVEQVDQSKFKYLANFDLLAKRNMHQVFLEMEQESF